MSAMICVHLIMLSMYVFQPWDGYKSTLAWASRDHCLPGIDLLGAWPAGHPCGAQHFCWVTQRGASAILLGLLPELKPMARARMGYRCHGWRHLGRATKRWRSAGFGSCRRTLRGDQGFQCTAHPDGCLEGSDFRHIAQKIRGGHLGNLEEV